MTPRGGREGEGRQMKLYEVGLATIVGIRCVEIIRRVIPPVGGKWIPYTPAEVIARRAAQMAVCVVCTAVPVTPAITPAPVPVPPIAFGPPLLLVPRADRDVASVPVSTPEPASALVLAMGLAALWVGRR